MRSAYKGGLTPRGERPGGATAIPPADTPPHSSPSTPHRPRLSRTRSGCGLPFGFWRRLKGSARPSYRGLWHRKPGTFKRVFAGPAGWYGYGTGKLLIDNGRK